MSDTTLVSRYDAAATGWSDQIGKLGYEAAYSEFIRSELRHAPPAADVCDVGTGSGAFASAFLDARGSLRHLTLIDSSPGMIANARVALKGRVEHVTSHAVSLREYRPLKQFDVVLAAHVIEHCECLETAINQLWQLVKPGGELLMVVSRPHWCQWLIWLRWRHRWYSPNTILQMSRIAGLPVPALYRFSAGPPRRTSIGYVFFRSDKEKD